MVIVDKAISLDELKKMSEKMYGGLVKAVVDVDKKIMVVDAELHADEESLLLNHGSQQNNLWGINIYPGNVDSEDFIEFDSIINLRPAQENRSRSVENKQIQEQITAIVQQLVQ